MQRTTDDLNVAAHRDISGVWASLRLALAALWLVAMVGGYVTHDRPANLWDLYASVVAGEVAEVQLIGGLPPEAESGSAKLAVHWRTGNTPYVADVRVVRMSDGDGVMSSSDETVTTDDVAREIAARDPAVQVVQTDFRSDARAGVHFTPTLFGWSVPMWAAALMVGVGLVSFYVLVAGPEPWRATRWAWFWLSGFPFAIILFLLLSGPTPTLPAPRNPDRRLTGGWAFLLSLVLPKTLAS